MDPVPATAVTGALVLGAKYARGKPPTLENGIGIVGILLGLSALAQANEKLARAFGALIVVSVLFVHGPVIFTAISTNSKSKTVGKAGSAALNGTRNAAAGRAGSAL